MSHDYINAALRRLVAGRAKFCCEYCLISENDTFWGCHIDHIISEKHGGLTTEDNLAYACAVCNRFKGSDIGSISAAKNFIRFFNPRCDDWQTHFILQQTYIQSCSEIGEVTAKVLRFNDSEQLAERQILIAQGHYPCYSKNIKT